MSHDESSAPPAEIRDSPLEVRTLPPAWQPVTPRGVAAFSRVRLGRLFVVQFLVAALTAGAVVWFLNIAWFPVALQAIRQLPETGVIANRQLTTPHDSLLPLAQNQFIAFFADTNGVSDAGVASDLRVGFHRDVIALCSLLGCLAVDYPAGEDVPFNRIELEPWWGAWEPMCLAMIMAAVVASLFASWLALATFYSPVAWMVAYLKDRQLTLVGSWKLAAAALLPGTLLATIGIVLYGLGVMDVLACLLTWVLHFFAAWVMLILGILALPKVESAVPLRPNPFQDPAASPEPRPQNPFAAPVASRAPDERK
jgi:hypothetical protein